MFPTILYVTMLHSPTPPPTPAAHLAKPFEERQMVGRKRRGSFGQGHRVEGVRGRGTSPQGHGIEDGRDQDDIPPLPGRRRRRGLGEIQAVREGEDAGSGRRRLQLRGPGSVGGEVLLDGLGGRGAPPHPAESDQASLRAGPEGRVGGGNIPEVQEPCTVQIPTGLLNLQG